jgi:hypothetical protein
LPRTGIGSRNSGEPYTTPAHPQVAAFVQASRPTAGQRCRADVSAARREDVEFFCAVLRGGHELRPSQRRRPCILNHNDQDPDQRRCTGSRSCAGSIASVPSPRRQNTTHFPLESRSAQSAPLRCLRPPLQRRPRLRPLRPLSQRCNIAVMAEVAGAFVGGKAVEGFAEEVPEGADDAEGGGS